MHPRTPTICRILLWHRSDNLAFAIVAGGSVKPGEGVECKIKGILQVGQVVDQVLCGPDSVSGDERDCGPGSGPASEPRGVGQVVGLQVGQIVNQAVGQAVGRQ